MGIERQDIWVSRETVFTKRVTMGDLNPYEKDSKLEMNADFYFSEILKRENIIPNDLPALLEIPTGRLLGLQFSRSRSIEEVKEFLIVNERCGFELPDNYALLVPEEVRDFLEKIRGAIEG